MSTYGHQQEQWKSLLLDISRYRVGAGHPGANLSRSFVTGWTWMTGKCRLHFILVSTFCFIQRHNFKLRRLHDKKSFSSKHISIQLQGNRDTHHQHHTVSPGLMTIGCVLLCLLHILVLCTSPSSQTKLDFYFNLLSFEFPFRINGMANVVPSKLG